MYKYFISFSCATNDGTGFGNTVVESNVRISDFESLDEMQKWINDVHNWIAKQNGKVKNVIVLNFVPLN